MKQVVIRKGVVSVQDVPAPGCQPGHLLIRVAASCISPGTELATVASSGQTLLQRVAKQPELVGRALDMLRRDGIRGTIHRITTKQNTAHPLGYSAAGTICAVGNGVQGFTVGQHVAAAGLGQANHAEYVEVPRNLVASMPAGLDHAPASTVALGCIAMHAVRRAELQLGEIVVVVGLGAIGQLVLRMCKLAGCRVIGIDLDHHRLDLARQAGADYALHPRDDDPAALVEQLTASHGADAAIYTAATTAPDPLSDTLALLRRRARLVMVGTYGDTLRRNDIYQREIDFRISTSYGPGRYDDRYEHEGQDYPYPYVRWTEQRNMIEYLRLLADGNLDIAPLIGESFPVEQAAEAFRRLAEGHPRPLLVVLRYAQEQASPQALPVQRIEMPTIASRAGVIRLGIIGPGGFAAGVHLPNLATMTDRFAIRGVASRSGLSARNAADHHHAAYATTDTREILDDPEVDAVLIATRHHLHGPQCLAALQAGKHVFVEKPLCLRQDELQEIADFYAQAGDGAPLLFVGYNRRFSPWIAPLHPLLRDRQGPVLCRYRMSVPAIPADNWVHGPEGGGRLIGEACHIVDLFASLINSPARAAAWHPLSANPLKEHPADSFALTIEYEDGSVASLDYFTIGASALPKEYLELHVDGASCFMHDYTRLEAIGATIRSPSAQPQDKGHRQELIAFHDAITSGIWPIPLSQLIESSTITLMTAGDTTAHG